MAAGANINGLIDPSVGVTPGPNYALTLNNNFDLIDSHDHSTGNGATINLANIAVNNDFSLASNGLLNISKLAMIDASALSISNSRSIYSKGDDLWFYNGSGLDIQITNASGIAAAAGNISGLVAPASASFSGNTFTFNATATTPGNLEGGDVILHNALNLTYKLTLKSPNLSSNVIETLPLPPSSSTSFVTMDTSGTMATNISTSQGIVTSMIADQNVTTAKIADLNVTTAKIADLNVTTAKINDGAVTYAKRSALNIQTTVSSGSGTHAGGWINLPNQSLSISTSGRPVQLNLISDGSQTYMTPVSGTDARIRIIRNGAQIAENYIQTTLPNYLHVDSPLSGTYTYTVQIYANYGNMSYSGFKFVAFEL